MVNAIKRTFNKGRTRLVAVALTIAVLGAGSIALLQPALTNSAASAASCDKVNIIFCGINASTDAGYVNGFQSAYNKNNDNGHTDLKAVYRWAGASDASVKGMNTSNSKIGTMDNHGNIMVNGKKVGSNSRMAARFRDASWNSGVVHIEGGVYARSVIPSQVEHSSYKVLVHFNSNGEADFAVAVTCGNAIKFTPVVPKPQLSCDSLTFSIVNKDNLSYRFQAQASAKNTTITSYDFHFGDGHTNTVKTNKTSASTTHSFAKHDQSYNAFVVVNSTRQSGVTSAKCHVTVKTPKAPVKPSLTCVSLTSSIVADQTNTYKFVAKAKADHTTITSYVFNFGDSKTQTVSTSSTTASTTHTFAKADTSYTVTVSVNSKDVKNVTGADCKVTVKTPPTPESPQLICQNLSFVAVDGQANTYKFTANADAANTTITGYNFVFGDGKTQAVTTDQTTATATHAYASADQDFVATVSVSSTDLQNVTSANCQVTVPKVPTTPPVCEFDHNLPPNSPECKPCEFNHNLPANSPECKPPVLGTTTELPNTGAGNVIGFFGATTIAGAFIHRFFLRRRVA